MRALILYSTTEGHTRTVCEYVCQEMAQEGYKVDFYDSHSKVPSPRGYALVFIGASMRMGKYQQDLTEYIKQYKDELNERTSALLSVCIEQDKNLPFSRKVREDYTDAFLRQTGWQPKAIKHTSGNFTRVENDMLNTFVSKLASKQYGRVSGLSDQRYEYDGYDRLAGFVKRVVAVGS